jgi:hypothetical protein
MPRDVADSLQSQLRERERSRSRNGRDGTYTTPATDERAVRNASLSKPDVEAAFRSGFMTFEESTNAYPSLRHDYAFMLAAVTRSHVAAEHTDSPLLYNLAYWRDACICNPMVLTLGPIAERADDHNFMRQVVRRNGLALQHASDRIRASLDINAVAMLSNPAAYEYVSDENKKRLEWLKPVEDASTSTSVPATDDTFRSKISRSCCYQRDETCSICISTMSEGRSDCDCIMCTRCAKPYHTTCVINLVLARLGSRRTILWKCPGCTTEQLPKRYRSSPEAPNATDLTNVLVPGVDPDPYESDPYEDTDDRTTLVFGDE